MTRASSSRHWPRGASAPDPAPARQPSRSLRLFQVVRIYSAVESAIFAALLVVWLGHVDERLEFALGLTHGVGFLGLCAVIYVACLRRAVPWPVLATAVLLTPIGSSVHIELLRRRRYPAGG